MRIQLFSPAKVNLFFRVLFRRPDGFHEIASLYQAISLQDTLTLALSHTDQLSCDDPVLPCDDSNLILKALTLFRRRTGRVFHLSVDVSKKIPMQAGLGGGSSNAATVLWGCNALLGNPVSEEELMVWGSELGSDVPFFFSSGTAYCQGRGEKLQSLSPLARQLIWIIKPSWGLSTPEVYRQCSLSDLESRDPASYLQEMVRGKVHCFNDLEHAAFQLCPPLRTMKTTLQTCGFSQVVMTGSGTAFLGIGQPSEAGRVTLAAEGWSVYPVNFCYREPGKWYENLSHKG